MRKLVVAFLAIVFIFYPGRTCRAADSGGRKPAVLFNWYRPDATVAKEIEKAGYVWGVAEGEKYSEIMTDEFLKQFNVVVLQVTPQVGAEGLRREDTALINRLRAFAESGGGLWICGVNNQDTGMCVRFQQELLKPYGATVLREFVNDKPNSFRGRCFSYTYTDQVEKDPLTEGVASLFYPMFTGWGGTSATNPIQADGNWKVLLRGMRTAYTCALTDSKPMEDKPATYFSAPPLLAVRQVGKGRIVLWPTLASCTFVDGYHYMWDDGLVLEGKMGERTTSQGIRLMLNLLKWLAEPSVQSKILGGYVPPPFKPRSLDNEPGFSRINWDAERVPDDFSHAYKVLIGARTALSSGNGTVAEYAAEAKKFGYSVLVFTEDLEKMNAAKWDRLVEQCKAATTPDLLVVQGLKFFDENGNQGVLWGDIGMPKDEWMSEKKPGCVKAIWHFSHGYRYWPPIAIIAPKANPKRPWFLGCCKGFAAYTYSNGKLVDESVDEYLEMIRLRFDNFVLAVHLMDSPAAVGKAAAPENMQTYIRSDHLAEVPGRVSGTYGESRLYYFPAFVSNGPIIDTFNAVNPGTADLAVSGGDRYRLRLAASSPAGLKEVKLLDGGRLVRRLAVNGPKYDQQWDFFHDRQRSWVADVTDQQGRRAISWARWCEAQEQWFTNCGDNWNFMDGGKWASTKYVDTRGIEAHVSVASSDWAFPYIAAKQGDKVVSLTGARPAVHVDERMVSRFASVVDYLVEGAYEPTASANWNDWCQREGITPLDTHTIRTRCTFFTSRPDEPQVRLIEGVVKFKKPVTLADGVPLIVHTVYSGQCNPGEYDHLFRCDAAGGNLCEIGAPQIQRERAWDGKLPVGGYLSIFPSPGGMIGAFALDDKLSYHSWMSPGASNFWLKAGEGNKRCQPGEELAYRFLVVKGRRFADPSNEEMEWIRTGLGLNGKPAYSVEPSVGKLLSTQFILKAQSEDNGFRAKFSRTRLPMDIPLELQGLNDRWCAGVWYQGPVSMWRPEWGRDVYDQLIPEMRERPMTDVVYFGPVEDGIGYFGIDVEKSDREVFAGNLLVCDQPEVFLQILDFRPGKRKIEVHNPTDKPMTVRVRPARGFDLLGSFEKAVDVGGRMTVVLDAG